MGGCCICRRRSCQWDSWRPVDTELASNFLKLTPDPVSVDQLIAHAHALARTTSAPVSSLLAPVDKAAATPWPNEAAMRQGLLFQLEGSMSGVGDVGVVGDGEYTTSDSSVLSVSGADIQRPLHQNQRSPPHRSCTRSRDGDTTPEPCSSSTSTATTRTTTSPRPSLILCLPRSRRRLRPAPRLYIRTMLYACSGTMPPTKTNDGV